MPSSSKNPAATGASSGCSCATRGNRSPGWYGALDLAARLDTAGYFSCDTHGNRFSSHIGAGRPLLNPRLSKWRRVDTCSAFEVNA